MPTTPAAESKTLVEQCLRLLLAGTVDLSALLEQMSETRPVYHSEADFQHHFAWEAHTLDPQLEVRLETHPEPNVRLDLLLSRPDFGMYTAVELKYLTRYWEGEVIGERFALKNHGAQDIGAYNAVKDIARVERFVGDAEGWNRVVVAITNDPSYWRASNRALPTNADAFRIHEGVVLDGLRDWGPRTGGTNVGRPAIQLHGSHTMESRDFSQIDNGRGVFRALVVPVP